MKKSTYREKPDVLLNADQFQKINEAKDETVIKNEKQINISPQQLMKQGKIIYKIYNRLRSTDSQPARLYRLTNVLKKDTPLRFVLSIPGSSHENLNRFLPPFFQKLLRASIENKKQDARKALETLSFLKITSR